MGDERSRRTAGMARAGALAALVAWPAAGCNVFERDVPIPDAARVTVDGSAPVPLRVVTSTSYQLHTSSTGQQTVELLAADTALVEPPFSQEYPIRPNTGFFVRLTNLAQEPADVRMRVWIDGERTYDVQATLQDASLEYTYTLR